MYAWIITKDETETPGTPASSVNVCGPSGDAWNHWNKDQVRAKGVTFKMYDDDHELYYTGKIVGDYAGFEPLDEFGMAYAGCTGIKYNGEYL